MTFLQDALIKHELANFRLSLERLNAKCEAAGLTLVFDEARSRERSSAGAAHRIEIVNAIRTAKGMKPLDPNGDEISLMKRDVLHFVRYIQTVSDITLMHDNGQVRRASASNDPIQLDASILGELQALFNRKGIELKIDPAKVMGADEEAGSYRVAVADAIDQLRDPTAGGTRPHEVRLSPVYDGREGKQELLQMAQLAIGSLQHN